MEERRRGLEDFLCKCIACEKDYPMLEKSRKADIPNIITDDMIPKMRQVDTKLATRLLGVFSKYLTDHAREYPCEQLMSIENLYHVCFEIAYANEVPIEILLPK